jgi:hypothetical protein
MANTSNSNHQSQGEAEASLTALAGYLELSLDKGKCLVMMRHGSDVCSIYVGNPSDEENTLTKHGSIATAVANGILESTHPGTNQISVGDETYRFFRSFTDIDGVGAVVFAPA